MKRTKIYGDLLVDHLVQSEGTKVWLLGEWNRFLAEGYVEVAPGILRHPDKKAEVHFG